MSEQGETAFVKEAQWRKDVWSFSAAFKRHWGWWVCSILGSPLVTIFIRARGIPIPDWILWLIGMSGVAIAAFRTWRDQKRLAEAVELELQKATTTHTEENKQMERASKAFEREQAERLAAQEKAHAEEKESLESELTVLKGQLASERAQRMKKMEAEPISTHRRPIP